MQDSYFVTPADAAQIEQLKGVYRRTMATTDSIMVCEFFLERDAVVPQHQHPHEQAGYVIYGKLEFTVNGQTRICQPGDTYQIPGGVLHSAHALVDTLLIDIFSPPREEYR
ncbi:MAG: cupin domain-containing protein [Anaerolineae bacterium]|nr:cupin domain-containing protein [Anaerolineae bacterium]